MSNFINRLVSATMSAAALLMAFSLFTNFVGGPGSSLANLIMLHAGATIGSPIAVVQGLLE
jgi:hypothetical protein